MLLIEYIDIHIITNWNAICRILKYLKGTMDYGIYFVGSTSVMRNILMQVEAMTKMR